MIEYKINSIKRSSLREFSIDDDIFKLLKSNYINFDDWFSKMQLSDTDVFYTELNNKITSILILKINETDSQQFFEKGNILKIRTLVVIDKNKGIASSYLKMINEIAKANNINYIYVTIKIDNKEIIRFFEKNNFKRYNQYNDEFVYYKEIQ